MALTEHVMKCMPNDHLVMALRAEMNSLTSTPAEIILLERFEELLDQADDTLARTCEEFGFEASDIKNLADSLICNTSNTAKLLDVIAEAGIDDPKELKTQLDFFNKFSDLAQDAGDVFSRLSQLTTTVTEE